MGDDELMMQALLGFERTMTHLDGRTIPLSRKGTTQPNEVEVIEGEGVSLPFSLSAPPALSIRIIVSFFRSICRLPSHQINGYKAMTG